MTVKRCTPPSKNAHSHKCYYFHTNTRPQPHQHTHILYCCHLRPCDTTHRRTHANMRAHIHTEHPKTHTDTTHTHTDTTHTHTHAHIHPHRILHSTTKHIPLQKKANELRSPQQRRDKLILRGWRCGGKRNDEICKSAFQLCS